MNHTFRYITSLLITLSVSVASHADAPCGGYAVDSIPAGWTMDRQFDQTLPSADNWWRGFDDPILNQLISRAEDNNYNLTMVFRRIEISRQSLRQARAAYFPSLGLTAGWTKQRSSGMLTPKATEPVATDYFSAGLSMNWEIDVFGKVYERSKQAKAAVDYSKAEYQAAMVALCSNIAIDYFTLRMYQAEYGVAVEHIASQEHIEAMTQARHDAGLASQLDVIQARVVLYSTRASIPALESLIQSQINSIATLVGCYAEDIEAMLQADAQMPNPYRLVATGVPMDLLRRRPDIVEAEFQLAQYAAQVGIAKKDFLPTLSLTGSIGSSAHRLDNLFESRSFTYAIAPQLSWTVFDGLARNAALASARSQMLMGIDNYNLTLLTAVNEVNDAMQQYTSSLRTIGLQEDVVAESRKSFDKSVDMYKQGLTAFSNVVDAQMSLLENQNSLITSQGKALVALVNLYQALGGGWDGNL